MSQNNASDESIVHKSITGSAFNIGASGITFVLGFARAVLLARLLLPEHFGLFALAMFFVSLAGKAISFGFNAALIHRSPHTREDTAAHFILRVSGSLFVCLITLALYPILGWFYPEQLIMPRVMLALVSLRVIMAVNSTPQVMLTKQLAFKRLAALDVGGSALALIVAGLMAWGGMGVWSLVGAEFGGSLFRLVGLWFYRRPWPLYLRTNLSVIKWYLRFGWFVFLSSNLNFLLDRFDDFWIGTVLGSTALGFYAKAYEFAGYPRRVVAGPVINVFFPTFAKLQHDRQRLSKAYFRVCSLVIRVGFLFSGIFVLVTPEFIRLLLGDKWLPMTFTFQLMLVYTLFNPLLAMSGRLITALGEPQALTKVKLGQMLFFVPAVILLARFFGINGVAIAADLMLTLGFVLFLPRVKRYVDFSLCRMFGYAVPALGIALLLGWGIVWALAVQNLWLSLFLKAIMTATVYSIILWFFERQLYIQSTRMVQDLLMSKWRLLDSKT